MDKLPVPENISLRWEAWRGFGRGELAATLAVTAGAAALAVLLVKACELHMLLAVGGVLIVFSLRVSVLTKVENNQSVADYFARKIRYGKEQQTFVYVTKREEIVYAEKRKEP